MQVNALNIFDFELHYLSMREIREFVLEIFGELCPDYFWYIRASQRGHHPPLMRTRGGLVHHTKLAVRYADSFCEMYSGLSEKRYNQIIAATLMHDMFKRGAEQDELKTFGDHKMAARCHGRYAARQILDYLEAKGGDIKHWQKDIIRGIELHMGRWTWDVSEEELYELSHDVVPQTTHLADYAASRSLHQWIGERHTDKKMRYLI